MDEISSPGKKAFFLLLMAKVNISSSIQVRLRKLRFRSLQQDDGRFGSSYERRHVYRFRSRARGKIFHCCFGRQLFLH